MTVDVLLRIADDMLDDDPWPLIRELGATGDAAMAARTRTELARCVRAGNWYGRDLLAHLLARLSGAEVFPLLLRVYADALRGDRDDDGERLRIALGLVMHADRAACRTVVVPMLGDRDPEARRAALWALGHVFEASDLETLRRACDDPDSETRRVALSALPGVREDPRAYALVVAALRDPEAWVRHDAVLLLAWSAPPAVVDHLAPLTSDPDWCVRAVLGEAIGRRAADSDRVPAAAAALADLLADAGSAVRAGAVRGLGLLGGPLDALQSRVDDPDWWVRAAVVDVLATALRRWPAGRPLLDRLSVDTDATVRAKATAALERADGTG
ncbi:HEAT repeat domain-containing protein [Micromonospora sp. WMMC241]|uniref:HEAT repeat domain-containing protein n=1 Tax=Micromonospora sp. WMMC241 TaxID=3015159 RepID=UPI0022B74592|nr:HEAT repeat domain-containing protein [Micromonospora sp. WMMC241]MCZ7438096.1 HEAT repeat domain-containing protein [Micromonospora sp. WMMC241]